MGNVVIVGGNKRAGKTTLSVLLNRKYGFNYISFDSLLDSIECAFPQMEDGNDEKYMRLLEEMVEKSLSDSRNYGISTLFDYIFTPSQLDNFKYKDDVQILFLANLDATEENVKTDLVEYSKSYDWPSSATQEDLDRNVSFILRTNELLQQEAHEYGYELVNTSRGENRETIISSLAESIATRNYESTNTNLHR